MLHPSFLASFYFRRLKFIGSGWMGNPSFSFILSKIFLTKWWMGAIHLPLMTPTKYRVIELNLYDKVTPSVTITGLYPFFFNWLTGVCHIDDSSY